MNPGLARALGTMLKQDFQRAVLNRIPRMASADAAGSPAPGAVRVRRVSGVCDDGRERAVRRREVLLAGAPGAVHSDRRDAEHQLAALDACRASPGGRSCRASERKSSWPCRTTSARTMAADLCGKVERLKPGYTLTEAGQDARVSMLTGRPAAHKTTVSAAKTYNLSHRVHVPAEGLRGAAERARPSCCRTTA